VTQAGFCDRVRGFWFGYRGQFGPMKDFLENIEFIRGWNEGTGLMLDEELAKIRAQKARGHETA